MSPTFCLILRGSRCLLLGALAPFLAVLLVLAESLFAAAPDARTRKSSHCDV